MNIIIVQSEGAVKFLALELVGLNALVGADVTDDASIGLVMSYLLYRAVFVDNHTIVAHIILYVVMPTINCAIGVKCRIAAFEQVHRGLTVLQYEITDVVNGIGQCR